MYHNVVSWKQSDVDGSWSKHVGPYHLRAYRNLKKTFCARVSCYDDVWYQQECKTLEAAMAAADVLLMDEIEDLADKIGCRLVRE